MAPEMDKSLRIPLIISFSIHTLLFFRVPIVTPLLRTQHQKRIVVTYYRPKQDPSYSKETISTIKDDSIFKSDILKTARPDSISKRNMIPDLIPDFVRDSFPTATNAEQKKLVSTRPEAVKKKVSLPFMESAGIKNPVYMNYFQSIRAKIKRFAYKNYTHMQEGSIYIAFILSSDGQLKESRVVDEKSDAPAFLKDIALRSIKEASPYPAFPKNLDSPQLPFSVIIVFELER